MEDDHVDRPGVEAPQGVELTGTNSSIGLIALINAMLILASGSGARAATREPGGGWSSGAKLRDGMAGAPCPERKSGCALRLGVRIAYRIAEKSTDQFASPFCRPGDYCGVAAPDPIPNSAVKRPSADGTPSQDAGE